jgi:hypothetical protein
MNGRNKMRAFACTVLGVAATILLAATAIMAQTQAAGRYLGTVTAISGNTLTVKTDAGDVHQVAVPDTASDSAQKEPLPV